MRRVRIELSDYEACEYLGYGSNLNVEMQRSVFCCGFQRRGVREGTPRRVAVVGVTLRVLHLVRRWPDNDDSSFGLPRNAIYVLRCNVAVLLTVDCQDYRAPKTKLKSVPETTYASFLNYESCTEITTCTLCGTRANPLQSK